jgi:hypothetical protein
LKHFASLIFIVLLSACMNMPTPTSQITGSHNSGIRYDGYGCTRLSTEMDSLSRRETQLSVAQEQRIKTSQMQAFWFGYGQGDGLEASELANVRGEIEALRRASDAKRCGLKFPEPKAAEPAPKATSTFQQ